MKKKPAGKPKQPVFKAPIDCSFHELIMIKRESLTLKDFWILFDSQTVTITKQKCRKPPTEKVSLPRGTMKRFIKFLTTPQELKYEKTTL